MIDMRIEVMIVVLIQVCVIANLGSEVVTQPHIKTTDKKIRSICFLQSQMLILMKCFGTIRIRST